MKHRRYISTGTGNHRPRAAKKFALTLQQMREVEKLLEEYVLHPDPVGLFDFIEAGIELRELAKFHFTRNLSDALVLIAEVGGQHGFSREDLAMLILQRSKNTHCSNQPERFTLAQHRTREGTPRRNRQNLFATAYYSTRRHLGF